MTWTFGAGTGDDITCTAASTFASNAFCSFVSGWFYPTTLTSGRFYCSAGNVIGISVDSTTDQLRIFTDNTTDAQYTCDPNITINKWWHISALFSCANATPTGAVKVWVGDTENAPTEVAVTQAVAPVGNFTGAGGRTVGNRGTGTVAFQGDIGCITYVTANTAASLVGPFHASVSGSLSQSEADLCLQKWVIPLWLGRPRVYTHGVISGAYSVVHIPMNIGGVAYQFTDDATASSILTLTTNGATYTNNAPPREPPEAWILQNPSRAA